MTAQPTALDAELEQLASESPAERALRRARELDDEAEILEIQAAALDQHKPARWAAYQSARSVAGAVSWRLFHDRLLELRASARLCRADAEHYRQCAAGLSTAPLPSRAEASRMIEDLVPACSEPHVPGVKEMRRSVMWRLYERMDQSGAREPRP